jgi:hypothetical protein
MRARYTPAVPQPSELTEQHNDKKRTIVMSMSKKSFKAMKNQLTLEDLVPLTEQDIRKDVRRAWIGSANREAAKGMEEIFVELWRDRSIIGHRRLDGKIEFMLTAQFYKRCREMEP